MGALSLGLAAGGLGMLGSVAASETANTRQRMQASQLEAQSAVARRQAELTRQQGEQDAYETGRKRSQIRRQFQELQSANNVRLGAGNVDMTSGSAEAVSLGNINRFANDMGENSLERATRLWQAQENARMQDWQADALNANSSYLRRTAGNLGTSLLTGMINGASSFASVYTMAGGRLWDLFSFNKADPSRLFAQGANWTAKGNASSRLIAGILKYGG